MMQRHALLALVLIAGAAHAQDAITVAGALAVVNASEAATKQHDVVKAASFMTQDCVILSYMPQPDGSKAGKQRSRDEYVREEQESEKAATDHIYTSTKPTLTIVRDQAIAKFRATEKATFDGKHTVVDADEIVTLEMRDGRAQIVKVEVTATGMTVDGKRAF